MSEETELRYFYRKCPSCGAILHVSSFNCHACGKRYNYDAKLGKWAEEIIVWTGDPSMELYCAKLCEVDKCVSCGKAQKCKYAYCFGSGIGQCRACSSLENARYQCCKDVQKRDIELKRRRESDPAFDREYRTERNRKIRESVSPFEEREVKTA